MIKALKVLKKVIIITLCTILVIFLVLLTAPFLFKDKIMEIAKTELNKMLLAKVEFQDLTLSFIRNFPDAYIALDGLKVTGVGDFEDELLVAFDQFSVTVDIMSVIKMENIEVKSILLDRARLNGIILEDGRANWDIMKPSEKEAVSEETEEGEEIVDEIIEAEEEASSPFAFKVGLQSFEIRNLEAAFRDDAHKMAAGIGDFNFTLRGNMKRENVDLKMQLGIDGIDFWLDGVRMANQASVGFISEVAADLKNMAFVIKDNRFNLNDIVLKFGGSVALQEGDINMDVTFATDRTDFKSLLSLVPAIYMHDFKDLRTTGSLDLSGNIQGTYNDKIMPSANVSLAVNNAMFSYPALPKSVEKINIAVRAYYDGVVFDRTTLDLDRFSFEMAGNPFNAEAHVKTPESDLQVAARFAGKIDFDSVKDIIPLDDMKINGLLECDLSVAGRLSTLQKEQYEDFQAAGSVKLSRFKFDTPAFPHSVHISSTELNFTPRLVDLAHFNAVIGRSDVALNGSLGNFIPFVLKGDTVRGTLALRANTIDLNQFMGDEPKEQTAVAEKPAKEEKSPMSVIAVPPNIDFALTVNIGNLFFDKLAITNTSGAVVVKDGKVNMRNLNLNLLEGSMTLNGEYNTQNVAAPAIDFGLAIRQFDISSAISSFSMLEDMLPEPQNYAGKVSATLNLSGMLDQHMSPVLTTINSKGRLQTHNLQLRNSQLFGTMADLIKNERWRTPTLGNLNIGFEIRDGRLWIEEPIVMNIQPARVEITGDQGLDSTLNYRVNATMPVSAIGSGATDLLGKIPGGSAIREIKLTGLLQGTAKKPDVSLSMADMTNEIAGAVRAQVTQAVTQRVDQARAQVSQEVNRQIDQIMAEAQRQADNIRSVAKKAADETRRAANAAADRAIAEADRIQNPVAKTAAQAAARKTAADLRSKGETDARKIEQEADAKAKAVMDEAQRRADQLRRN